MITLAARLHAALVGLPVEFERQVGEASVVESKRRTDASALIALAVLH